MAVDAVWKGLQAVHCVIGDILSRKWPNVILNKSKEIRTYLLTVSINWLKSIISVDYSIPKIIKSCSSKCTNKNIGTECLHLGGLHELEGPSYYGNKSQTENI